MAPRSSTSAEPVQGEARLLESLLALYTREAAIYRQVADLSRRQGELIRRGADLGELRHVLEQKRQRLNAIAALEIAETQARACWERNRDRWSAAAKARLHRSLSEVGALIEEILDREEENDRLLMGKAG
jgi:hypothetical protein